VIHQFTDALTPEMDEDSGKRDGKPLPTSQRPLPSMLIESEIGRSDRDVLKSVGTQVERLIQDMMEYGKGTCVSYIDHWQLGPVMYNQASPTAIENSYLITASFTLPCSSRAIRSASSISSVPNP